MGMSIGLRSGDPRYSVVEGCEVVLVHSPDNAWRVRMAEPMDASSLLMRARDGEEERPGSVVTVIVVGGKGEARRQVPVRNPVAHLTWAELKIPTWARKNGHLSE